MLVEIKVLTLELLDVNAIVAVEGYVGELLYQGFLKLVEFESASA